MTEARPARTALQSEPGTSVYTVALDYLKALRKYVSHCHIKDVSPALAAAVRGEETGIGSSEVFVGGGVNADNIRACMEYLAQTGWDGVVSLECSGTDENTRKSVEWMRGLLKR